MVYMTVQKVKGHVSSSFQMEKLRQKRKLVEIHVSGLVNTRLDKSLTIIGHVASQPSHQTLSHDP